MWSVNDGLSGNLQKPAAEVSGRFLDLSINRKCFEKKFILIKNSETCRKPLRPVSVGFQRFRDNPSFTDHTAHTLKLFPIVNIYLYDYCPFGLFKLAVRLRTIEACKNRDSCRIVHLSSLVSELFLVPMVRIF